MGGHNKDWDHNKNIDKEYGEAMRYRALGDGCVLVNSDHTNGGGIVGEASFNCYFVENYDMK